MTRPELPYVFNSAILICNFCLEINVCEYIPAERCRFRGKSDWHIPVESMKTEHKHTWPAIYYCFTKWQFSLGLESCYQLITGSKVATFLCDTKDNSWIVQLLCSSLYSMQHKPVNCLKKSFSSMLPSNLMTGTLQPMTGTLSLVKTSSLLLQKRREIVP